MGELVSERKLPALSPGCSNPDFRPKHFSKHFQNRNP